MEICHHTKSSVWSETSLNTGCVAILAHFVPIPIWTFYSLRCQCQTVSITIFIPIPLKWKCLILTYFIQMYLFYLQTITQVKLVFDMKISTKKTVLDRWKTVKRRKGRQGTNKPGPVLEVVLRVLECLKCQQHPVFPCGHPSKYWLSSMLLNLGDCLVTVVCSSIWLLANVLR